MAARKPKGIVSPWLGASKNIMVAGKTSASNMGSSEAQIDTGGGERDKVNETLMLGIAGAAGVTAATLGARAIVKTGVVPATIRSVVGRDATYFVHGSPTKGIKKLDPKYELQEQYINAEPYFAERWPGGIDERSVPAIYGNPLKQSGGGRRSANQLVPMRELRESVYDSKGYAGKYGSLYVAKVPKNKFYDQYTENPAKVIREIDVTNLSNKEALTKTLDTLKKLGFKQPKLRGPKKR